MKKIALPYLLLSAAFLCLTSCGSNGSSASSSSGQDASQSATALK